jgi:hypothetical protein
VNEVRILRSPAALSIIQPRFFYPSPGPPPAPSPAAAAGGAALSRAALSAYD